MRFVLDNSVAMRWLLSDRAPDVQDYARGVLQLLANGNAAVVPNLFTLEAANVLAKSQKRGLVTEAGARAFLALLADLDIETDATTHERALHDTLNIAMHHELSAYDAAYLELALREGLALATLDRDLSAACVKAGGKCVQP
ncbi:MAG: type II toxin-antitoxin system VapC family toxin [Herminiimonas sp.]|nr:type II toxin-antitoxin system VapC family toxin [Herminiimonas sp.]